MLPTLSPGRHAVHIFYTIIPIFFVILLGLAARSRGYFPPGFLEPANRLIYYLAIPAMIFHAISKGSLKGQLNFGVLAIVLVAIVVVFAAAMAVGRARRIPRRQMGTFVQCTFHGNLGYIGLAVVYYALGSEGFVQAGILAGFVMILQNFLAVVILQIYADDSPAGGNMGAVAARILGNPVIVSAFLGILFSASGLPLPLVLERILDILSGMALPMALLIIGASLSFDMFRMKFFFVLPVAGMKLLLLPGIGCLLGWMFGIAGDRLLPGIILLASPSATLTYVMAKEMNGDADLAVAAISSTTMASALTFAVWLYGKG